jgi:hypothetical protein
MHKLRAGFDLLQGRFVGQAMVRFTVIQLGPSPRSFVAFGSVPKRMEIRKLSLAVPAQSMPNVRLMCSIYGP